MAPILSLQLTAPDVALAGSVPVPSDDGVILSRVLLSLISRGESSLIVRHPSRAVTSLLSALELLGLVRSADADRVLIQGVGLGPEALRDVGTYDLRGEAASSALLLAFLAGRKSGAGLLVDTVVGETLGSFLAERELATLEPVPGGFAVSLHAGKPRWPGFEVQLSGAIPWLKQALLLLGLRAQAPSIVSEAFLSADHFERGLFRARAPIHVETTSVNVHPPRDPDAFAPAQYGHVGSAFCAAHLVILPLCVPRGGQVTARGVSANRSSAELWSLLRVLGADIRVEPRRDEQGEPTADITLSSAGPLRGGATVTGEQAVRLGDTVLPLLVALSQAKQPSLLSDLAFLRGDGSPWIVPRAVGYLRQAGFFAEIVGDSLRVGGPQIGIGPLRVTTGGEGRLALLGGLLGLTRAADNWVDDVACLSHVFPRFTGTVRALGGTARIVGENQDNVL